jgi:uncharacterized protein (DUF2344 family)
MKEVEVVRSDDKISSDLNVMNDSVYTINCIINEEKIEAVKDSEGKIIEEEKYIISNDYTDDEKKERVNKNVLFLEAMLSLTDWKGSEDWTDVDKAITDGKDYVG